jgi:mRNA interferase HicA
MNAKELKKLLKKHGCTFEPHKGGSGHVTVRRKGKKAQMPMHGSSKELGTGLVKAIFKQLDIE